MLYVSFSPESNNYNKQMAYLQIRGLIRDIFFLLFLKNICCGYSLEAPRQGTSNEYHDICFHGKIKKNSINFG